MDSLLTLLAQAAGDAPAATDVLADATWLHVTWFAILGVLLIGYAILDGFDLGTGMLHLFVPRDDYERRISLNAIGPLWDGNEVWLVTFGGALFAAFPNAYATAFSGFYLAFMLLLLALISRAVSIEFRSKVSSAGWRRFWDAGFFAGSALAALLFGVAVGDTMVGLPISETAAVAGRVDLEYIGTFWNLLGFYDTAAVPAGASGFVGLGSISVNFFPLVTGLLSVVLLTMHGAIYMFLKTEGELQARYGRAAWRMFFAFCVLYATATILAVTTIPTALANFDDYPVLWILAGLNALAIANIPRAMYLKRAGYAFISSCATVAALVVLYGAALFPNMLISNVDPSKSLTIVNAASSESTLTTMLIITVAGMPIVLTYTAIIYWTFRGKVELGKFSY